MLVSDLSGPFLERKNDYMTVFSLGNNMTVSFETASDRWFAYCSTKQVAWHGFQEPRGFQNKTQWHSASACAESMVLAKVMGKAQRDNDKDSLGCWRARPVVEWLLPRLLLWAEGKACMCQEVTRYALRETCGVSHCDLVWSSYVKLKTWQKTTERKEDLKPKWDRSNAEGLTNTIRIYTWSNSWTQADHVYIYVYIQFVLLFNCSIASPILVIKQQVTRKVNSIPSFCQFLPSKGPTNTPMSHAKDHHFFDTTIQEIFGPQSRHLSRHLSQILRDQSDTSSNTWLWSFLVITTLPLNTWSHEFFYRYSAAKRLSLPGKEKKTSCNWASCRGCPKFHSPQG